MHFFHSQTIQSFILMAMRGLLLIIKFLLTLFITHYLGFEELGFFGLLSAAGVMAPSVLGFGMMYDISRHAVTQTMPKIVEEVLFYGKFITAIYAILMVMVCLYGIVYDEFIISIISILIVFCEHINGEFYSLFLNLSRPFFANSIHFIRTSLWAIFYMIVAYFYPQFRTIEILLIFWLIGSVFSANCYLSQLYYKEETSVLNNPKETFLFYCKKLNTKIKESSVIYANTCVTALTQYADRYIITAILGLELAGVYIFFWQLYSALSNLLYTGVIQIYRPKLVLSFKEKANNYLGLFKSCLKKSVLLATIFAIITIISIHILIPHFNKPLIEANFTVMYIIFIGFIISIILEVLNLLLYSSHHDKTSLKIKLISFVVIIILNSVLTITFDLNGAGIAFLLSMILQLLITHFYLKKYNLYAI